MKSAVSKQLESAHALAKAARETADRLLDSVRMMRVADQSAKQGSTNVTGE